MSNLAPGYEPIQKESVAFNQPASESAMDAIGSAINGLLQILMPVGSYMDSDLTEPQFQAQIGNPNPVTWVLADGRNVAGSAYAQITGNTNIPDYRGIFVRYSNNGGSAAGARGDGNQNPDGTLPSGTFTPDRVGPHKHMVAQSWASPFPPTNSDYAPQPIVSGNTSFGIQNTDGVGFPSGSPSTPLFETAPKNNTTNRFIRIN